MDISIILFLVGLVGLIIGSITDLRTHEVPDWINYGLMMAGLGIRLIESYSSWDYHSFMYGVIGFVFCYILGVVMFYTGQWGGGDSKMIMGLGALFATYPVFLYEFFTPDFGRFPFLVIFFLNVIIFGGFYGIFWTILLIFRNFKRFSVEFKSKIKESKKYRILVLSTCTGLLIISSIIFIYDKVMSLYLFVLMAFIYVAFYMSMIVKSVETSCLCKIVTPDKLTIGDWIVDDIFLKNKKKMTFREYYLKLSKDKKIENAIVEIMCGAYLKKGKFLSTIYSIFLKKRILSDKYVSVINKVIDGHLKDANVLDFLKEHYGYTPEEYRVTGPSDLGIEKEQIQELIEECKKGNIDNIKIKEGIPFVPSFLIAFIVTIIWGNLVLIII